MILGDLSKVFEDEQSIMEAVENNILTQQQRYMQQSDMGFKKPTRWSKILKTLSSYGMNYDDDLFKNMRAIPADKALQPKDDLMLNSSLYNGMLGNWKEKGEEEKPFREKTIEQKIQILRKLAMQPELEDILDTMANESIVYDDDEAYIAQPFLDTALIQELTEKSADEIRSCVDTSFYKIYLLLNWKDKAWDDYKRFLIDGVLAYQIIYDDIENPRTIINIISLNPATLTRVVDIENNIIKWIQFKDVQGQERELLDSEVIYIKYEDSGVSTRQSYLERLIRPFNLYRIVEQAQVIWTVTQSSFKTMFTIPINGMNKAKGIQTLSQAMNRYKENISFNSETGELQVNGKVNLPFNKEYWFPENETGKPSIETIVDNGPQLNDSDQIRYFESKLYKMSKIPENRFDKEAQTSWFGSDPTQALHDEIAFGRFVTRLRNRFAQIILKPLRIQLALSIPDIKNDKRILDAISLRFNSYNQFQEMMEIEINTKRVEFISTMKELTIQNGEEEEPYFHPKFLIMKYLKMSDADLELNEKIKREEALKKQAEEEAKKKSEEADKEEAEDAADDLLGGGDDDSSGGDLLGGGDEEGSSETEGDDGVDSEMLGDVQPESSETTQA
jgi:hypothetical protein